MTLLPKEDCSLLFHDRGILTKEYYGIVGIDEAGRGALAGPVMAAALWVSPLFYQNPEKGFTGIKDSKLLSAKQRSEAFLLLQQWQRKGLIDFAYAEGSVTEIEVSNIGYAVRLAMRRAIEKLQYTTGLHFEVQDENQIPLSAEKEKTVAPPKKPRTLIDGLPLKGFQYRHMAIVRGDQLSFSIAAASIVAKVNRDQWMERLSIDYPVYHLGDNKGYATQAHRESLKKYGPSEIHRQSFLKNKSKEFAQTSWDLSNSSSKETDPAKASQKD